MYTARKYFDRDSCSSLFEIIDPDGSSILSGVTAAEASVLLTHLNR